MRDFFTLDPNIIFLNHGSFGATPRIVLEAYQNWQIRLERQPVQFITREMLPELKQARQTLGKYLNADADDLVYIPNATFGVNLIARSLQLKNSDRYWLPITNMELVRISGHLSQAKRGLNMFSRPCRCRLIHLRMRQISSGVGSHQKQR